MKVLLFLILLNLPYLLICQQDKSANIWYFSENNGLDFNTNPPTLLSDGQLKALEGTAVRCDANGQLQIYTNGEVIWNKNHEVLKGGDQLAGHLSSTQSSIIVPSPGQEDLLYVFYLNESFEDGEGEFYYATVDMTLDGGLGEVVSIDNLLHTNCSEKLIAIPNCNEKDYWIIAHELDSNKFIIWNLTKEGIGAAREIPIGLDMVHQVGYMKSSLGGRKIAVGHYVKNAVELFDFNTQTGMLSNPIPLIDERLESPYGVAFSPNSKRLYVTNILDSLLIQINIDLPTPAEIQASITKIVQTNKIHGAIQNGPDGKLYIAVYQTEGLSRIHQPNELGTACDFREVDLKINGFNRGTGLPNFVPIPLKKNLVIDKIELIETCDDRSLEAFNNIVADSVTFSWLYEDQVIPNATTNKIPFESNGRYEFKAVTYNRCSEISKTFTKERDLQVAEKIPLSIEAIDIVDATCETDNAIVTILSNGGKGSIQYAIDDEPFQMLPTFENLAAGNYMLSVKDDLDCVLQEEVEAIKYAAPKIAIVNPKLVVCGDALGRLDVALTGGKGEMTTMLDGNMIDANQTIKDLEVGSYQLQVRDETGCIGETLFSVQQISCPIYIPTVFSPNGDGQNDLFQVYPHPDFKGTLEELLIYDRWGNFVFNTTVFGRNRVGWDGSFKGEVVSSGSYLYHLLITHRDGREEVITGDISLIR